MQTSIFLFVAYLSINGWVTAPPSEYATLGICKRAQQETERGFRGDVVDGKTKCTRDFSFEFDLDPNERPKRDDWMGTNSDGKW